MRTDSILLVAALAGLGACTEYDPNLPAVPFFCGTADPKCPEGYTCMPVATGNAVCAKSAQPGGGNCTMPFSGLLATWNLVGELGSQASTAGTASAPGVTVASLSRAAGLMAQSGTDSINSSNWPSSTQLDATSYYTLSISLPSGCSLALTSLAIDVLSSATGPAVAAVATSSDAFAQSASVSTTTPSTPTLSVSAATGSVEIRIYGYSASSTGGTMRVRNALTLTGSLD